MNVTSVYGASRLLVPEINASQKSLDIGGSNE